MNTDIGVYLRVSTRDQDVKSQRMAIERDLARRGWTIPDDHWFTDQETGATLERPGFVAMRQAILDRQIRVVVFSSIDRLARDMVDGLVQIRDWQHLGVKLIFVDTGIEVDPSNWFGQAMLQALIAMQLAMAQAEREKISERRRNGIELAKQRQAKARALREQGQSIEAIAAEIGEEKDIVRAMLDAGPNTSCWWKPKRTGRKYIKRASPERIRDLVAKGLTINEICTALRISSGTVKTRLKQFGGAKAVLAQAKASAGSPPG